MSCSAAVVKVPMPLGVGLWVVEDNGGSQWLTQGQSVWWWQCWELNPGLLTLEATLASRKESFLLPVFATNTYMCALRQESGT